MQSPPLHGHGHSHGAHGHHHGPHIPNTKARNLEISLQLIEVALVIVNIVGALSVGVFGGPQGALILGTINFVGALAIGTGKVIALKMNGAKGVCLLQPKLLVLMPSLVLGILGMNGLLSPLQLGLGTLAASAIIFQIVMFASIQMEHSKQGCPHHGHAHRHPQTTVNVSQDMPAQSEKPVPKTSSESPFTPKGSPSTSSAQS